MKYKVQIGMVVIVFKSIYGIVDLMELINSAESIHERYAEDNKGVDITITLIKE